MTAAENVAVPHSRVLEIGEFLLEPERRRLTKAGEPVAISAKAFDALVFLAERAGRVVSRAELCDALWPRAVVEDNNLSQTILALRRALGDASDGTRFVATVPRRGYQLVAPVRVRAEGAGPASVAPAVSLRQRARVVWRRNGALLLGGCALLFAAFAGRHVFDEDAARARVRDAAPAVPSLRGSLGPVTLPSSVAVLPFRNLSPNADDAYFAAGMHEEVLSQLGRIKGVNVIGSTSVRRYEKDAPPIPEIAADLNVAAVVEGSVRYAAERVRVAVRLVDGTTSMELWSETYESELDDVFRVQADIAQRIATALEPTLAGPARAARKPTESPAAYALYLRALSLYRTHGGIGVGMPVAVRETMLRHLDDALALDSEFAAARAWRAHLNLDALMFGSLPAADWAAASAQRMRDIEADARRALETDGALGRAQATLARLDMYRWRLDDARATLDRALERNPSDPDVLHYSAMIHYLRGEPNAAIAAARRALEIDPKNPAPHAPLSMALRMRGDVPAAIATYEAMIDLAPAAALGYAGLARTLTSTADAGRAAETLGYAEQFLEDTRSLRLDVALSYAHFGRRADAERLVAEFERRAAGQHVDASLEAMAALARGDHVLARAKLLAAIEQREAGMDPLPLAQLRDNTWSDPVLDEPEWLELRKRIDRAPSAGESRSGGPPLAAR